MSKVYADKIEPRDSTMDVTIGTSSQTVTLAGNDLRANTVKDSGGNSLWTSDGSGNVTLSASAFQSNLRLIQTQTPSDVTSVDFTGIDSTYNVYIFTYIGVGPQDEIAGGSKGVAFQGSVDGGLSFGVTAQQGVLGTNYWYDGASGTNLTYETGYDMNNAAGRMYLSKEIEESAGGGNACGEIWLFNPSSTSLVTLFQSDSVCRATYGPATMRTTGYFNTTSAINAITFLMADTGNVMDGKFKMYGLL